VRNWTVNADRIGSYELRMVEPLLAPGQGALSELGRRPGRRLVILDDGAGAHWEEPLRRCLRSLDIEADLIAIPGGEAAKSMEMVESLLQRFQSFGVDRRAEPIIIVGGGAVLDVGAFAASIYRRGVPYIRVPTTLLAYVDASIGVKTGINFKRTKNLVGSFAAPALVLLDRAFFRTLPSREISSGMGELIKLAVGCDALLFEALEKLAQRRNSRAPFAESDIELATLDRAIDTTIQVLGGNIYEGELSRPLDLGHTFSQAFEMAGPDVVRHGEAVAWDVNMSAILAVQRGLLSEADAGRIAKITSWLGLPTQIPDIGITELWASALERSQHRGGRQRIPLPVKLGRCIFADDIAEAEVETASKRLRDGYLQEHHYRNSSDRNGHVSPAFTEAGVGKLNK
jgi:2-epi-5-epi-valiolone synthase